MSKRLISDDAVTGIKTSMIYDADKDEAIITKEQDISSLIEANKQAFNAAPDRFGEWSRVGSIPLSLYYEMERKGMIGDQVAMAKWLNDPDNRAFRTRPGTI